MKLSKIVEKVESSNDGHSSATICYDKASKSDKVEVRFHIDGKILSKKYANLEIDYDISSINAHTLRLNENRYINLYNDIEDNGQSRFNNELLK